MWKNGMKTFFQAELSLHLQTGLLWKINKFHTSVLVPSWEKYCSSEALFLQKQLVCAYRDHHSLYSFEQGVHKIFLSISLMSPATSVARGTFSSPAAAASHITVKMAKGDSSATRY